MCLDKLSLLFPPELSATILHCMTVRGMSASHFAPLQVLRSYHRWILATPGISSRVLYAGSEGMRQYRCLERIA